MKYNVDEIKKDLKSLVNERRYKHSLMVADEAVKLAQRYNYDEDKTYITALVHDIAKNFTDEENLRIINKYHLDKRLLDEDYRNVLHADIGSYFVKEKYAFDDNICEAIRYHALGNKNMNMLDKIIYIADKIGRDSLNEELEEVKNISYNDIDEGIKRFIELQMIDLERRGLVSHPETLELYEVLSKK